MCIRDSAQTVKQTWRDYGAGETLDGFELYVRLSGLDKGRVVFEAVQDWREAQELPALVDQRQPQRPTQR